MPDQSVEKAEKEFSRLLVPRATPNARFLHELGEDIHRAAVDQIGQPEIVPFQEMVVELRKLVQLLRRTLLPACARRAFVRLLGEELQDRAVEMIDERQRRVRWLMLGGVLGSALSLLGVIAALSLRRRQCRLQAKKPVGI